MRCVADYNVIDVRALHELGADARIIDVREAGEWAGGPSRIVYIAIPEGDQHD